MRRVLMLLVLMGLATSRGFSADDSKPRVFPGVWYRTPEKRGVMAAFLASGDLTIDTETISFASKKIQLAIPTWNVKGAHATSFPDDPVNNWFVVDYDEGGAGKAVAFKDGHMTKNDTAMIFNAMRAAVSAQAVAHLAALHTTRVESLYYSNDSVPKDVWKLVAAPDLEEPLLEAYAAGDPDDLYRYNLIMILNRRSGKVEDAAMRQRIHDCMLKAVQKDSFGWAKVEALDGLSRLGGEKEALAQADLLMKSDEDAAIHEDVAKWIKGATKAPENDLLLTVCTRAEAAKFEAQGHKDKSQQMAHLVCQISANVCREKPDDAGCKTTLRELDEYLHGSGSSMLFEAAQGGRDDLVKSMLGLGSNVNAAKADGWTALMAAAAAGNAGTVQALIGAGADAALANKDGKTALALAEAGAHTDVAGILKGQGQTR
jgi:Ankyrin repeats (3 copies)